MEKKRLSTEMHRLTKARGHETQLEVITEGKYHTSPGRL